MQKAVLLLLAATIALVHSQPRSTEFFVGGRAVFPQDKKLNFFRADFQCKEQNLRLFAPRNPAEAVEVHEILEKVVGSNIWVGIHCVELNRQFKYLESGKPFLNDMWAPEEPNNINGKYDCVEMYLDKKHPPPKVLNDVICSHERPFICENHYD